VASPRWIPEAPVEWVPGELGDRAALDRLVDGVGTVIHLAGVLRAPKQRDFDAGNRGGTHNLVQAINSRAAGARLVHVSSLAAAGPSPSPTGKGPDCQPEPISWYGASKLAAERALEELAGGATWCVLRPPAIYGPRDTDIFEFFRMASRGLVAIPAGERWLTVAWVGDVVRAVFAAAVAQADSVYHVGEAAPLRLEDLVGQLCRAGGVAARVLHVPQGVVTAAGAVGSALQRLGLRRIPITADKSRELLARHWTSRTEESMAALGVGETTDFSDGAEIAWSWYRARGWLP
jgi:nucleoside-diphosphate-sugar epimerase